MKWDTCTWEASTQCSKVHILKMIQCREVKHIYSRIFNKVKWGICTQESSIKWSEVYVLKNLRFIGDVHVSRSFNIVK